MNVTFRQLRLFLALAETGSVSRAAARMHVTQPTASAQLKELTDAVGLPLHEVISRRVHLTDAGRRLAQAVAVGPLERRAGEHHPPALAGRRVDVDAAGGGIAVRHAQSRAQPAAAHSRAHQQHLPK